MRLLSLKLTNFLNHASTELEFGPVTVIAGPNNAGKSAIKDAIEMVLTGTARTTDKAGRDAGSLVRTGAKSFTVEAKIALEGPEPQTLTVTRSKAGGGKHELVVESDPHGPWQGTIPDKEKALQGTLHASHDLIRACIHAGRLPEMKSDEQEALLFATLGLEFTIEKIEELLILSGCKETDVALLSPAPSKTFLAAPERAVYGPGAFDEAYKFAYELRRQAKRDLAAVTEDLEAAEKRITELLRETPALANVDEAWIERNSGVLADLERTRDELLIESGRVENLDIAIAETEASLAAAKERLKARKAWEKKRDAVTAGNVNQSKDIGDSLKAIDELTLPDAKADLARKEMDCREIQRAIATFSEVGVDCPLADMACPLSKSEKPGIVAALKKKLEPLEERRASIAEDVAHMEKAAARSREVMESEPQPRMSVGELERLISGSEAALKQHVSLKKSGRLNELPALTSRITTGRAKMRVVQAFQVARGKATGIEQRQASESANVEACERLVEALGPGGAKLAAVQAPLEELEKRINLRLSEYAVGYEIAIRTAEGFELVVRTPETDGGWIATRGLSTSERLRVGIALQDALSHISGLGFLLVDNFDMLDRGNRTAVGQALGGWSEEYGTILILTTADKKPAANENRKAYWIDHGQAEVIS